MMNIEPTTDTKPKSETSEAKNTSNTDQNILAGKVTIIILVIFGVFIIVLMVLLAFTSMSDLSWNRYIYLMTAIETITFAAVGWLFGKEVYRGQAEQTEKQMKDVKEESKQQISSLKYDIQNLEKHAEQEKEKADRMIVDVLTERKRGHALYQAIQQVAQAQKRRQSALRDVIDAYQLNQITTRLTEEDIYILLDSAKQLYPEI